MDIMHVKLILFLSFVCLCARLSVCQAPPTQAQNARATEGRDAAPAVQGSQPCPPGACPPRWISMLDLYSGLLNDRVMQPVCQIAISRGFISSCNTPERTCGNNRPGVSFCCCPAAQLSKVQNCLPNSLSVCIPDNFAPWQSELQAAIFGGMLG